MTRPRDDEQAKVVVAARARPRRSAADSRRRSMFAAGCGRSSGLRISRKPRPCDPNSGLSTSAPAAVSRCAMARACVERLSRPGVGRRDAGARQQKAGRRFVDAALDGARVVPHHDAEFAQAHAGCQAAASRLRRSRPTSCARARHRAGHRRSRRGADPVGAAVCEAARRQSNRHRHRRTPGPQAPRQARARASRSRSATRPTIGRGCAAVAREAFRRRRHRAGSRSISPAWKAFAGFERGDGDLCRTEQHRIDGVEVAFERLEDLRERPAVVARALAGKPFGERARLLRRPGDEQMHLAAENDGVVGAAHGGDEIRMRRRTSGAAPMPSTMRSSGKCQFVGFVQRDFEHARHDLRAAGEALRRREDDRQTRPG